MKVELLREPLLEFGEGFLCADPKTGIITGGFFSSSDGSHHSEIQYGAIGTSQNVQELNDWISEMKSLIEPSATKVTMGAEASIEDGEILDIRDSQLSLELDLVNQPNQSESEIVNKKLNPDFPGLNKESPLSCEMINMPNCNYFLKDRDLDRILDSDDPALVRAGRIIDQYKTAFEVIVEDPRPPKIVIVVIPQRIYSSLSSISIGNKVYNFRRQLKAELMSCSSEIPVQLVLEKTIKGEKKSMQDKTMVAWNFSVAQYYKTNSIPWTISDIDPDACFIGISFHKAIKSEGNYVRSSVAQAFNRNGQGLVFVGKQFEWNSRETKTSAPHLPYEYAKELIKNVINVYVRQNRKKRPIRVAVHKTTDYWDEAINRDYMEIEGLRDGIEEVLGEETVIDFVTIKNSPIKLLRTIGKYPVPRGTFLQLDRQEGILYTTGYIPYYETFPGMHMPLAKSIKLFGGDSSLRQVCKEILALTKMNFNNCNYYSSLPITLLFSKKVGEIIQYLPEGITPPNKYYFYM